MMNFRQLLLQRPALVRAARLANVAFAYDRLREFAQRIERARLRGRVTVYPVDPEAERYTPAIVAHEGSQAVLDEHFLDEHVLELADVLQFLSGETGNVNFNFSLEDVGEKLLPWARAELASAGIAVPSEPSESDSTRSESASSL